MRNNYNSEGPEFDSWPSTFFVMIRVNCNIWGPGFESQLVFYFFKQKFGDNEQKTRSFGGLGFDSQLMSLFSAINLFPANDQ